MDIQILKDFAIIFGVSMVVVAICYKARLPMIVGFLLTGVLAGPHGLQLIEATHPVEMIAEVGVVLLMFALGLELSLAQMRTLRKPVFIGGGAQVLLTILAFTGIGALYSYPINKAVFFGFLISLSSTAIVLKVLQERAMSDSPTGRISLSILIFQDLVAVPMMLAIPLLAGKTNGAGLEQLFIFARNVAGVIILVVAARWAIPRLLARVVRTRNREFFLLAILAICLGVALITSSLGLSLALGAFLAGLFISESKYSLNAVEGILPFRDVFLSVFFISVGMLLDLGFFFANIGQVLLLTLIILLVKSILAGGVTLLLRYPVRPSAMVGLALCQVGEFSLVLAREGLGSGLISDGLYQLFLASCLLSMGLTPLCMMLGAPIAVFAERFSWLNRWQAHNEKEEDAAYAGYLESLKDHLIIVGYGLAGKQLAKAAESVGIPYVVLEMNPDTVESYRRQGVPIIYGDAAQRAVLEHVKMERARVLAVLITDPVGTRRILSLADSINPAVYFIARTRFFGEISALRKLGANEVIVEEFEVALEVFYRVLHHYLVPADKIEALAGEFRAEGYQVLRGVAEPANPMDTLKAQLSDLTTRAVAVEKNCPLMGKTLQETDLRRSHGVAVVAVKRGEKSVSIPDGSFALQADDIAYLLGPLENILATDHLFKSAGGE